MTRHRARTLRVGCPVADCEDGMLAVTVSPRSRGTRLDPPEGGEIEEIEDEGCGHAERVFDDHDLMAEVYAALEGAADEGGPEYEPEREMDRAEARDERERFSPE